MNLFLWTFFIESVEAYQRSFDRGMQMGHQRRNKASHFTVAIFLALLLKSLQVAFVVPSGQTAAFTLLNLKSDQLKSGLLYITGHVGMGEKTQKNHPPRGSH